MKKILGISLVAVLAVSPLMAHAENELGDAVAITGTVSATGDAFTTQSYVKGAYNVVEEDLALVNAAVTTLNGNVGQAGSVLKAVKDNGATATYNSGTQYAANTIGGAIQNAISSSATSAGAGLSKNTSTGVFSVNVDGDTIVVNSDDELQVKDGSIGTDQLASGVVTSLGLADSAVQSITTGNTAGTILVDETEVAVKTDNDHQFVSAAEKTAWSAKQAQLTNGTNNMNAQVATSIASTVETASDEKLLSEKAIKTAIEAAKTAATYNDTALSGRVTANETAIATNNRRLIPVATGWANGTNGADTTSTVQLSNLNLAAE